MSALILLIIFVVIIALIQKNKKNTMIILAVLAVALIVIGIFMKNYGKNRYPKVNEGITDVNMMLKE